MARHDCGIPEERWVDWLSGRLPADVYDAMGRHLESCETCRSALEQWRELLAPTSTIELTPLERAGRDRYRNKLRRKVMLIGVRRHIAKIRANRGAWAAAACFALLLVSIPLLNRQPSHEHSAMEKAQAYAAKYEPSGAALIAQPDTIAYSLRDERPTATVWVNGNTQEMFMLLEGLLPSEGLDVQAWGNLQNRLTNLGLLEFHMSQGHLYSHIEQWPNFEEVVFTIEPKGGSVQPTAMASAVVRLAAEARR